ncbi:hypothetical protein [Umezawaea sp. Da 62-37]|uniref:hypothetical protein n=1 Tax=Umezawaea sp. Da 62-37 TaxID=3075927 RepID=UPI0028F7477A|nr:hypothetical protein [Umezawaea sp. Da 62-37]WNV85043.1 hypothetical protein RM788_44005 [Umezawaea sp. Da 62-37]
MIDVRRLAARTARLRRLDNLLGGADTHQRYRTEAAATSATLAAATCSAAVRRAGLSTLAEQQQLAGWAAFDAGLHGVAKSHHLTSLDTATDAAAPAFAGNALAFLAYQSISVTGPDVQTAAESVDRARDAGTPRIRALLLERLAWTHAVAGDVRETERALDAAEHAVTEQTDVPEPDWVYWVDADEMRIMASRCYTQLHLPLRAVPALTDALDRFDDTHARDKALYCTSLARAYLHAGEVPQAALVAARVIELSDGVGSVRPRRHLEPVLRALRPHRTVPEVAELLELDAATPV